MMLEFPLDVYENVLFCFFFALPTVRISYFFGPYLGRRPNDTGWYVAGFAALDQERQHVATVTVTMITITTMTITN